MVKGKGRMHVYHFTVGIYYYTSAFKSSMTVTESVTRHPLPVIITCAFVIDILGNKCHFYILCNHQIA